MTTPRYPSATNVFIPQATGQAVAYVRNPSNFKLNQYVQLIPTPKPVGVYAFLDPDEPARVVTSAEYDWPPGQPAPRPAGNIGNFKWEEFRCKRKAYPYSIAEEIVETAEGWNPRAFYDASILNKAMTDVTARIVALMENPANWGDNTASVETLNGNAGKWDTASSDSGSSNFLAIKKSLLEAIKKIHLASNGVVKPTDLRLIISPDVAMAIANTSEIHSYLAQQAGSIRVIKGEEPLVVNNWGVPNPLYGIEVVVEDAVRVVSRPAASGARAALGTDKVWVKNSTTAVIAAQPGGVSGNYGSQSFSTFQRYFWEYEMRVEAKREPWDKLYEARVVDYAAEVLPAPQTGFLITGVL